MSDILTEIFSNSKNSTVAIPPPIDPKEFQKVIDSRRSVRKFTSKPIPKEVMSAILDAALKSPNSSNLQSWQFFWIQDPEIRKSLNAAFLNQPAVTTAQELVVCVARTKTWKKHAQYNLLAIKSAKGPKPVQDYYEKMVPLVYGIGPFGLWGLCKKVIFWARGLYTPTPRECTSKKDVIVWAVKTTALACQSMMLAARAYGFDSCPMEGMDSARVRKILKLPKDAVVVMGISFGERAADGVYGAQFRVPKDEVIKIV